MDGPTILVQYIDWWALVDRGGGMLLFWVFHVKGLSNPSCTFWAPFLVAPFDILFFTYKKMWF